MKRFSHFYGLKAELEAFWKGFWFFEVLAVRVLTLNMKNDETFEGKKPQKIEIFEKLCRDQFSSILGFGTRGWPWLLEIHCFFVDILAVLGSGIAGSKNEIFKKSQKSRKF